MVTNQGSVESPSVEVFKNVGCSSREHSLVVDLTFLDYDWTQMISKGPFQARRHYDTTISQEITFKIDYHMVWFQDEDILLVNTELGLKQLWILGNRASCMEYSNQQVISRKYCLLCLFIAMETSLVSTAFFVQSTVLPTYLRHSQHDCFVTFLLNYVGNQEESRHQAAHALLQSHLIRLLSKSQIKGNELYKSSHLQYEKAHQAQAF